MFLRDGPSILMYIASLMVLVRFSFSPPTMLKVSTLVVSYVMLQW